MMTPTCHCSDLIRLQNLEQMAAGECQQTADAGCPPHTFTQLGFSTLLLWPRPSWPHSLDPKLKRRPEEVATAVCSSPQEIATISSFLIQNLLGAFSANLDLPNVNTAPVAGISGSSITNHLLFSTEAVLVHIFTTNQSMYSSYFTGRFLHHAPIIVLVWSIQR